MTDIRWKDKPQLAVLVGTEKIPGTTIAGGNDNTLPTPVALAANSDIGITLSQLKQYMAGVTQSITSASTITPNTTDDIVAVSALAVGATIANPSGTAAAGQGFVISILDNGTARALTWGSNYVGMGAAPIATTTAGKLVDIPVRYSAILSKWVVYPASVQQ
ncbi:MAG: hypothetical protein JSR63_07775 [Proteobacteria bacterium]|nr:hypothetical protein [Pseudomonadota bacterium]